MSKIDRVRAMMKEWAAGSMRRVWHKPTIGTIYGCEMITSSKVARAGGSSMTPEQQQQVRKRVRAVQNARDTWEKGAVSVAQAVASNRLTVRDITQTAAELDRAERGANPHPDPGGTFTLPQGTDVQLRRILVQYFPQLYPKLYFSQLGNYATLDPAVQERIRIQRHGQQVQNYMEAEHEEDRRRVANFMNAGNMWHGNIRWDAQWAHAPTLVPITKTKRFYFKSTPNTSNDLTQYEI